MANEEEVLQGDRTKDYLDERRSLIDSELKHAEYFDRSILTLSGGALALSLVFIEKIAPHPSRCSLLFLVLAWLAFVASMLSTLISFQTSVFAFRKQRDIIDAMFQGKPYSEHNILGKMSGCLNITAIAAFIIGTICLLTFSVVNLYLGGTDAKRESAATAATTH